MLGGATTSQLPVWEGRRCTFVGLRESVLHDASIVGEDKRGLGTTSVEDKGHNLMKLVWDSWPRSAARVVRSHLALTWHPGSLA